MDLFELVTVQSVQEAIKAQARSTSARFIAGGTNLADYMKLNVERPTQLIDINRLPLNKIEPTADGGLKIGALARNADVAVDFDGKGALPNVGTGSARRCITAVAQHGHRGRQSAAEDALRLLS